MYQHKQIIAFIKFDTFVNFVINY